MKPRGLEQSPRLGAGWWWLPAWLPIPLLLVTMLVLWVADVRVVWPLPRLYLFIHYGSAVLGIAFIVIPAARSFAANGQPSVLMLGCGVLMSQLGAAAMPLVPGQSLDRGFAIYNTSVLLSGLCHFAGMAITSRRKIRLRRSATWLTLVYVCGVSTMGLVIWGACTGRMPTFFIEGQGGTLVRSLVVSAGVALFLLTAGLLWQTNRRAASPFFYWYALGLVLLAAGLTGSMLIAARDSPLQWITRSTQVFGLVYMCVAVLASAREPGVKGIPLARVEEVWGEKEFLAGLRQQTPLRWALRYGFATAAVTAGFGLWLAIKAWFGPGLPPFITFYPAVMVVALLAGLGPGLLAAALTELVVACWLLPPAGTSSVASPTNRIALVLFGVMGVIMSAVAELYRRSRDKAATYDREVALRESQARLAMFAQATFEGIIESQAGRIVACNEQFAQLAGCSVAALKGVDIADLVALEDRDRVMANIRQGRESSIEHAMLRKDGARILVEAHGRPLSAGSATRFTAIRDITARKQAEEQLRQAHERLALAQRSAGAGMWDWDVTTGELQWSPEMFGLFGLDPAQAKATFETWRRIVHPEDRAAAEERIRGAVQNRTRLENEYRIVLSSGEERWISAWGDTVYDADSRPLCMSGICLNITARKRAEETLRFLVQCGSAPGDDFFQSLARYLARSLGMDYVCIDRLQEGSLAAQTVAVWFDGRFEDNVSYALKDTPCGDVVGKTICCFPAGVRHLFPKDVVLQEMLAESYIGTTLWNSQGRPIGLIAVLGRRPLVDPKLATTVLQLVAVRAAGELERRQSENALRQSEERYRTLFSTLMEGFCIIEVLFDTNDRAFDYRFLEVNPAFEAQTGLRNAQGKRMRELAPAHEAHWFEIYGKVACTGEPARFVNEAKALNRWYVVSAYRVGGRDSRKVAILFNDITQRHQAEEVLRAAKAEADRANAAKDQFLAALSHELRTPLSPVLMLSQLLAEDASLPEPTREDLSTIRQNVLLEARLIDDLLDLTRITRGKIQLKPEIVDVHALLEHAALTCCDQDFTGKRLSLKWGLAAEFRTVWADPTRLEQVFWNLIRNAIKFTPQDGRITIRTANLDGGRLRVEIADTGTGIEPDRLTAIFDPFEQGGVETTRRFGGLGLGLAISKAIVELHKGRIEAASAGSGQGATFSVTLAIAAGAQETATTGSDNPARRERSQDRPSRILLVEDHLPTAHVLERLMKQWGWEVQRAASVKAGMELAARHAFDFVVSDIGLPDGDGHNLMRHLRNTYGLTGIAVSGFGMDEDVQKSLSAGFVGHLTKPVDFEELREVVTGFLVGAGRSGKADSQSPPEPAV